MSVKIKDLELSLFFLRLGVFIVMFMWTLDKFINPEHTSAVFKKYYMIEGLGHSAAYVIGSIQLLIVLGFLVGYKKKITYGIILILHAVSTLSAWNMYIDPWGPKNLLFFAAFPMLAAIAALYILRSSDNLYTVKK